MRQAAPKLARREAVRGYRGGYLPLQRREIEHGLRDGEVRGVVATNALELGIDIGQLEAAVLCRLPRHRRQHLAAGGPRRPAPEHLRSPSSSPTPRPLDQFIVAHPDYFFGRSPENGLVNPDNLSS